MEPIVGIDLGTTNSAIAILDGTEPRVLENTLGSCLTPSAVARDPRSEELVVGRTAKDILALHPEAGVAFFKRAMGRDDRFPIGAERLSAVELSACVLTSLLQDAERSLGRPVQRCVVTVPAYFNETQRMATIEAGRLAGVEVVRIINEPTAAAICYGLHERERETVFVVFDLGGGTLDVCVMELFEGALEVRSTAGVSLLGGEDFTAHLRQFVLKQVGLIGERVEMEDPTAYSLLYARCEVAKRRLSEEAQVEIVLPPIGAARPDPTPVQVTQEQAHACWEPLLKQLVGPIRSALRGARLKPEEIEEVILVGGATRMPVVRAVVRDLLGREPLDAVDPDLAIARGAAIQAALCADHKAVEDIVVSDVASHSLGVDFCREMAGTFVDGYFSPIIHRNTVLPVSRTKVFVTALANQRRMDFGVYEGEARRVEENRLIGQLSVKGIPKGPAGQEVTVTFTFDLNGILEVEAKVNQTGRTYTAMFDRTQRPMSRREVEAAQARIASIRADPAQRPELRDLLAHADLLVREIVGFERDVLAQMIATLEGAMLSRTPSLIDSAEQALRELCDQLSGDERW